MKKCFDSKTMAGLTALVFLAATAWLGLAVTAAENQGTVTSVFAVEGMTCGGCELGVKLKVKKLEGVVSVDASYDEGEATVAYDSDRVTPADIIAAIKELGYTATLIGDAEEG